jgi:hypothetical protein
MCPTTTPCAWHWNASVSSWAVSRRWPSCCPPMSATATRRCGRMRSKPMINSRTMAMKQTTIPQASTDAATTDHGAQRARAGALHLYGLLAHWGEVASQDWVGSLLAWEEQERSRRSLERRLGTARIGRFKPICDFDWAWPKRCDRAAIEALMTCSSVPTGSANPCWRRTSPTRR